jgi:hypothetical protein
MFGANMSRAADLVVGGWRLSSILLWQTGPYITPSFPAGQMDPSGTGSGLKATAAGWDPSRRSQHADKVEGVSAVPANRTRLSWINGNAYACPGNSTWIAGTNCTTGSGKGAYPLPIGRFGTSRPGNLEGPHLFNLSGGLSKTFAVTEKLKVKAEGSFTNVLNHTNLGNPNTTLSSAAFGRITATTGSDFGGARTGQVSIRADF